MNVVKSKDGHLEVLQDFSRIMKKLLKFLHLCLQILLFLLEGRRLFAKGSYCCLVEFSLLLISVEPLDQPLCVHGVHVKAKSKSMIVEPQCQQGTMSHARLLVQKTARISCDARFYSVAVQARDMHT
eukprot:scpid105212/ scgid22354/ 